MSAVLVKIPDATHLKLKHAAIDERVSVTRLINELIDCYLKGKEEQST